MGAPNKMIHMFRRTGGSRCIEVGGLIQRHLDASRRCGLTAADFRLLRTALSDTAAPMPAEPLARLHAVAGDLASGGHK